MGSVFLYLAIVLMWLCVLVPMWLRRDRHHEAELVPAFGAEESGEGDTLSEPLPASGTPAEASPAEMDEPEGPLGHPHTGHAPSIAGAKDHDERPHPAHGPGDPAEQDAAPAPEGAPLEEDQDPPAATPVSSPAERRRAAQRRRARLIARRRRRTLWSVLLVLASTITAAVGVVSWWGVLPSVFLLLGYLTMLRTAVRVDAERRAHAARARAERARRLRERRRALDLAARQTAAEIIELDLNRRVELFDQYADPPRRAVGD